MSTVPRMRSFFRKIAVASSALTLIFFCSCERHHPEELPAEHAESAGHAHPGEADNRRAHERSAEDAHHAAPGTAVVPIPTTPAPTPAEFFPESTPH